VEKTGGESPQMVGGFTIGFPGKAGACESEFVEGELIVKFKEGFSPENALEGKVDYEKIEKVFSKSTGGGKQKVKESKEEKALSRTHRVIIDKKADIKKVAEDLEALPGVEYAEPNYIRYPTMVPNDPYFSSVNSWGRAMTTCGE